MCTLLVALLEFVLPQVGAKEALEALNLPLTFMTTVFPAAAAAAMGIQSFREHRRLAKRSESMARVLKEFKRRIHHVNDPAKFNKLILEIDELMLRENQDWLGLMRYVEVKAG